MKALNFLSEGDFVWFSKTWQCCTQSWIDGEKATDNQIKHGLILIEE